MLDIFLFNSTEDHFRNLAGDVEVAPASPAPPLDVSDPKQIETFT